MHLSNFNKNHLYNVQSCITIKLTNIGNKPIEQWRLKNAQYGIMGHMRGKYKI